MVEKFPILEKEVLVLKAPNSKLTLENDAIEKSLLTLIVKKNSNPPKPKPNPKYQKKSWKPYRWTP